jgi:catechol 2,3-dioxygenase-like lactoylglutathione lyase family enzyme
MRLDHVSVTVADLDRSIAFYRDAMGLPFLGRGESDGPDMSRITGLPEVRLEWAEFDLGGGQLLELLRYGSPVGEPLEQETNRPGSGHVGLAVDDIDAAYRRLVDAGVTVRSAPVQISEAGDWSGVRSLYALDPDGVTIELVERRPVDRVVAVPDLDAVREDRSGRSGASS